jgi:hypothetical protein
MKKHSKKLPPKQTLRLHDNHTWKAPDGYKIFVMDRGAVSFNIPETWVLAKIEPNVEFNDCEPPDDEARLSVSMWRTPPGIDWTGLPLGELLQKSAEGGTVKILSRSGIIKSMRTDLEMVWTEHKFRDPKEKREAFTRIAIARGWDVHVLITVDFWVDDLARIEPMWEEVLRSIQLGRVIEDPTRGVTLH